MAKIYTMPYRRKRQGRTDYKKRLVLLKSGLPRLVIRASNKSMQAQLAQYLPDGDKILATVNAAELKKHGWKGAVGNTPAAYLTGLLLAQKLKKHKLDSDVIVDIGLQKHHPGGRIYAVAKGAIDGGLKVRVGEDILPADERISGEHLENNVKAQLDAVKKAIMK